MGGGQGRACFSNVLLFWEVESTYNAEERTERQARSDQTTSGYRYYVQRTQVSAKEQAWTSEQGSCAFARTGKQRAGWDERRAVG